MTNNDSSQARRHRLIENVLYLAPMLWIAAGVLLFWVLFNVSSIFATAIVIVAYLVWLLLLPISIISFSAVV